jgi:hypothetical protein
MGPVSGLSGGLISNCCVANAIEQGLTMPADSAVGAAALIKKDEAAAQARRAAVRYLGTVDCNWWPEAEEALKNALLKDRNECVRLEAALALQKGCCCRIGIIKALTECISGTSMPPENSERVKMAAAVALSRCCGAVEPASVEPVPVPLEKEGVKKAQLQDVDVPNRLQPTPNSDVYERARRALAQVGFDPNAGGGSLASPAPRPGSVAQILSTAFAAGAGQGSTEQADVSGPPISYVPPTSAMTASATPASANSASALAAPSVSVPAPSQAAGNSERRPFFYNLTMALKGKQNGVPAMGVPMATAKEPTTLVLMRLPSPVPSQPPAISETLLRILPASEPEISTVPVILPIEEPSSANIPDGPRVPN